MTAQDDHRDPKPPTGGAPQAGLAGADPLFDHLYQGLRPYLDPLSRDEFQGLLGGGSPSPAPAAHVAANAASATYHGQGRPPELPPEEVAVEEALGHGAHPQYQGVVWWRRTMDLMAAWNQARRRLGHLSPHYQQLIPYWQQPDWPDFNQARRQADSQGADYQQWTAAQFSRPGRQDQSQAPLPQEMHGPQAQLAWHDYLDACRRLGQCLTAAGPPYTNETFDLYNPQHVTYVQAALDEIMVLAARVLANDPQGPALLLAQAVQSGNLPLTALELVPQLRERVLRLAGLPLAPGQY